MKSQTRFAIVMTIYITIFGIGLYLIIANKDWRGYVALISTPMLHTLVKAIDKQLTIQKIVRSTTKQ